MKPTLAALLIMVALTACSPDPRNAADAERTRLEAQSASQRDAQALSQAQRDWEITTKEREQLSSTIVERRTEIITWWSRAALAAGILAIGSIGLGFSQVTLGLAATTVNAARLRSTLVYLDAKTGTFPLVTYKGAGRYTIADPNTGMTMVADSRHQADRAMIAAAMGIRLTGVATRNAIAENPGYPTIITNGDNQTNDFADAAN